MMNRKFNIAIVGCSLLLYIGLANLPFRAKPFGDYDFHIEAKTIARFIWGKEDYSSLSVTKAPGPVFFYIIPYMLAGPDALENVYWFAGIIWTGLFLTWAVFLLKWSCENFGDQRAGRLAVVLTFILPLHIYYSLGILAEGLAFFGCCLQIFALSKIYQSPNRRSAWVWLSLGYLLMILARPNALLILPLALLVFLWLAFVRKEPLFVRVWRKFLVSWLVIAGMLVLITSGIRQLPNTRQTAKQEGYLGFVATIGRYQFREEPLDWRFWDGNTRPDSKDYKQWQRKLNDLKASGQNYLSFVVKDIVSHPAGAVRQFFTRVLFGHALQVSSVKKEKFGFGSIRGARVYWTFHILINTFNFILIFSSLAFLMKKDASVLTKLIVIPWLALLLFHGIIYMEQRYLFPIRPVIIVLSSLFLTLRFFPAKVENHNG